MQSVTTATTPRVLLLIVEVVGIQPRSKEETTDDDSRGDEDDGTDNALRPDRCSFPCDGRTIPRPQNLKPL